MVIDNEYVLFLFRQVLHQCPVKLTEMEYMQSPATSSQGNM